MNKKYTPQDLMSAIVDLGDATAHGFATLRHELRTEINTRFDQVDRRFDTLEYKMNKRFDSVDLRFDAFERRVQIIEQ